MKSASSSIVFNPSKTVALQLEHLANICQLSTDEIMNDVLGNYLDQMFGNCPQTDLLTTHISGYAHPSHKKAEAIANAYNAFSLATARELKRNWAAQATVVKDSRGISRVQVQVGKPLKETTRRAGAA